MYSRSILSSVLTFITTYSECSSYRKFVYTYASCLIIILRELSPQFYRVEVDACLGSMGVVLFFLKNAKYPVRDPEYIGRLFLNFNGLKHMMRSCVLLICGGASYEERQRIHATRMLTSMHNGGVLWYCWSRVTLGYCVHCYILCPVARASLGFQKGRI